jgi:hypothetical protein
MKHISAISYICWVALFLAFSGPRAWAQAPVWQTVIGASGGSSQVRATAPDGNGNVYLVGLFSGTATFGSTLLTSAGGLDIFVAKWNEASNTFVWAQRAGGASDELAQAVAVNGPNVYVGGYFLSPIARFGSLALTNGGGNDVFTAKITDAGAGSSWTWAQRLGGTGNDVASSMAVNGTNLYVAGYFSAMAGFGDTNLTSAGDTDIFIAKMSDTGGSATINWAQRAGGIGNDFTRGVTVQGTSVFATGSFSNTASFGASVLTSVGNGDIFVTKLSDAGSTSSFAWAQRAGGNDLDVATAIAVNGASVYIAGYFYGTAAAFGSTTLTNVAPGATSADMMVAKLTDGGGSGSFAWAQRAGGIGSNDAAQAITVSGTGVYVAGYFDSPAATFGSTILTRFGSDELIDVFVTKLTDAGSTGSFVWAVQGGGIDADEIYGMAMNSSNLYVVGFVTPSVSFGDQHIRAPQGNKVAFLATLLTGTATATATRAGNAHMAFAVFPNPTAGTATVSYSLPAPTDVTAEVLDALGRKVVSISAGRQAAGAHTLTLPALQRGLYTVRLGQGETAAYQKLIVE